MENENKLTIKNLISAILFLVLGIVLIKTNEDIMSIVSKVIGVVLIIVGIIKSIQYIYMKGKLGNYSVRELISGLLIICLGVLFLLFATTLGLAIRLIVGIWTLFAGINRLIFAISFKNNDVIGFRTYLGSSIIMIIIGIIITSGLFEEYVGIFIIIYAVSEIVDYVYCKVSEKKESKFTSNNNKKVKKLKQPKVVDAIIEENENK